MTTVSLLVENEAIMAAQKALNLTDETMAKGDDAETLRLVAIASAQIERALFSLRGRATPQIRCNTAKQNPENQLMIGNL